MDTYEVIKAYAEKFKAYREGWRFLRGSPEETKELPIPFDQDNKIRGLYDMANAKERVDREEIMKSIEMLVQSKR